MQEKGRNGKGSIRERKIREAIGEIWKVVCHGSTVVGRGREKSI